MNLQMVNSGFSKYNKIFVVKSIEKFYTYVLLIYFT